MSHWSWNTCQSGPKSLKLVPSKVFVGWKKKMFWFKLIVLLIRIILNRCEPQEFFFVEFTIKGNKSSKLDRGKNDPIIFINILLTSANIHVEREREREREMPGIVLERECVCEDRHCTWERERECGCVWGQALC